MFSNILVPVDFSAHSTKALLQAIALAKEFGAKIHLLHSYHINPGMVSPYGMVLPPNLEQDVREAAAKQFEDYTHKVASEGVEVEATLSPAFPSEAITAHAERVGADLIVMGTRGLTGVKHVLLGSVAERTVRAATCPVLTVKDSNSG